MTTKFEVGKTYPTKCGGDGRVTESDPVNHPDYPLAVTFTHRKTVHRSWVTAGGKYYLDDDSAYDLLLPAIEAEGVPAGFGAPTIQAMRDLQDFWAHFRDAIKAGIVDPTTGGDWPEREESAVISRTYPSVEAALSDCALVISGINSLLEGRGAK